MCKQGKKPSELLDLNDTIETSLMLIISLLSSPSFIYYLFLRRFDLVDCHII